MSFKLFKKSKVENSTDLSGMHVELPKSKKEMPLEQVIEGYDKFLNMNGYANGDHMVKVGENEMSVNDLVKAHMKACNDLEAIKAKHKEEGREIEAEDDEVDPAAQNDSEREIEEAGMEDVGDRGGDKHLENDDEEESEEEDEKKKKNKMKNKLKNKADFDEEDEEFAKAVLARIKAKKLKNANLRNRRDDDEEGPVVVETAMDQVARGKARYGSN